MVTHLAEQDDIRTLSQRAAQRVNIVYDVIADLTLCDDTLVVAMDKLDRVLHRDDVSLSRLVDVVNHAGKRCGLAAAGRACNKDQTGTQASRPHYGFRNSKLGSIRKSEANDTQDDSKRTSLVKHIRAESSERGNGEREVIIIGFILQDTVMPPALCVNRTHNCFCIIGMKHLLGTVLLSKDLESQRKTRNDKHIRRFQPYRLMKDII